MRLNADRIVSAATFGEVKDLASSVSSIADSPLLKTPSLDIAAPAFTPKSAPGFNGKSKTGTAPAIATPADEKVKA